MPKGPQGQKRPADTVSAAVMVGKIATGEAKEEVAYVAAPKRGSAGGQARSRSLSTGKRQEIAKAGATARWEKERRVEMTNEERLLTLLFDNPGREHADIKFFVGGLSADTSREEFCGEAVSLIEQMDAGKPDNDSVGIFQKREVADFLANI